MCTPGPQGTNQQEHAERPPTRCHPSWYRVMRVAPLALAALAGFGCRRGALEDDGGGTGIIAHDGGGLPGAGGAGGAISGSDAAGGVDGPGGRNAPPPSADVNCGKLAWVKSFLAAEFLIVLDRSIALDQASWISFLSSVAQTITAKGSQVDWGLYAFPTDGPACGAGTVTSAIDV